jgi:hypothetical protein
MSGGKFEFPDLRRKSLFPQIRARAQQWQVFTSEIVVARKCKCSVFANLVSLIRLLIDLGNKSKKFNVFFLNAFFLRKNSEKK